MINGLSSSALRARGSREARTGIFSTDTSNRGSLMISGEKLVVMAVPGMPLMEENGRYHPSPGKLIHFDLCSVDTHLVLLTGTLAAVNHLHQYESSVRDFSDTGA